MYIVSLILVWLTGLGLFGQLDYGQSVFGPPMLVILVLSGVGLFSWLCFIIGERTS
jgi:hypothetical protein